MANAIRKISVFTFNEPILVSKYLILKVILLYNGSEVKIYDAARMDGEGTPGEIVNVSEEGVVVQGNGGRILIKRVRPDGSGKIAASEWASTTSLQIGSTLGN